MFYVKDHKTGYLFDPWEKILEKKRRHLMETSWAGFFRREVLAHLPVGKLKKHFCDNFGRPTKELFVVCGVLILQQALDLSDEETIAQLAFNMQWHYALDITDHSDQSTYMCPKTLWNMRTLFTEHQLEKVLFSEVTGELARQFDVDTDKQRLDSVHIQSNMRRLGRIGILSKSVNKFLVNLRRQHKELFFGLEEEVVKRYLTKKNLSCFSRVKPSESKKTLQSVASDLYYLITCFQGNEEVKQMSSYRLLERVLSEQCEVKEVDGKAEVSVKPSKEVPSDSLQNPSDPDASYDGHKGQGYQVQVMETYSDAEDDSPKLNLITHVAVEPAHNSDANALAGAISDVQKRGLCPSELLSDSLYGSDENCEKAQKENGVKVISPTMGTPSKEKGLTLEDFELSSEHSIVKCPAGDAPQQCLTLKSSKKAMFSLELCSNCARVKECPVKQEKKHYSLRYDDKRMRLALRRQQEATDEFRDRYRWRAGVEATMSEYDRKTGVKRLRVRGLAAVRLYATLKALGVNIFRAARVRAGIRKRRKEKNRVVLVFVEVIAVIMKRFKNFFGKIPPNHRRLVTLPKSSRFQLKFDP